MKVWLAVGLSVAVGAGGCSLFSDARYCEDDLDCAASELCGGEFVCVPGLRDAGEMPTPVPPDRPRGPDDDDPDSPVTDGGRDPSPGALADGRTDGGSPIPPSSAPTDGGSDENGRPWGTEPGDTEPLPPTDGGPQTSDDNGRCLSDEACAPDEVCTDGGGAGVCVSA